MHPGMMAWLRHRRDAGDCGSYVSDGGCHTGHRQAGWRRESYEASSGEHGEGGGFGVRRPLRFLAYKLELNESQVSELAAILNELKTERAQGEVDSRRTVSAFADALTGESFDDAKAGEGAALRVKSAERLRDAVLKALKRIHVMLEPDQRAKLAYLIRTGTVSI